MRPGICGCNIPDDDLDGDGIIRCKDNCPDTSNADQADGDADAFGDVCDNCPVIDNPEQEDTDRDSVGALCDCDDKFKDVGAIQGTARYVDAENGTDAGLCASPTDACKSIAYAITQAGGGDTLILAGQIFSEPSLSITTDLSIFGKGPEKTIVQSDESDSALIVGNNAGTAVFCGLTITGGSSAGFGGGIRNLDKTIVANSIITGNNSTTGGGGIYNQLTLTVANSVIRENTTSAQGGGIYNVGNAFVGSTTIVDNTAAIDGGGVYSTSNVTFNTGTISGNTATTGDGGGVATTNSGTTIIGRSTANNNLALLGNGGGFFNSNARTLIETSTISGNSAQNGGGVYYAALVGGVQTSTLKNSTVTNNTASVAGGGIFNEATSLVDVSHTIIASQSLGDDCAGTPGTVTSLDFNLETAMTCSFSNTDDQQNAAPLLDNLDDNGGPTLTHELLTGSPAIDAGAADCGSQLDQRIFPRPVDVPGVGPAGEARCDVGAFEVQVP